MIASGVEILDPAQDFMICQDQTNTNQKYFEEKWGLISKIEHRVI